MDIVSGIMAFARHYVEVSGWPIFVLGRDKTTLPNCRACALAGSDHDREACPCPTCHGFYAATRDLERLERMVRIGIAQGGGALALRTGRASGITVIDAESGGDVVDDGSGGQLITGLRVLDEWEQWTPEGTELGSTLRARSGSGGLHLLYLTGSEPVKSRNRVLPGVDIKSDGGYVALPCGLDGRKWLLDGNPSHPMPPGAGMWDWLRTSRGGRVSPVRYEMKPSGVAGTVQVWGYDFSRAAETGARGGERDVFFRDLIFRVRMAGYGREEAERFVHSHWLRCEQPNEDGTGARWYMPWEHVAYKIEHAWRTLTPFSKEERMRQQDWARKIVGRGDAVTPSE